MPGSMMKQNLLISDLTRHAGKATLAWNNHRHLALAQALENPGFRIGGGMASSSPWSGVPGHRRNVAPPDAVARADAIPLDRAGKMLKNTLREQFGNTLTERGA